MAIIVTLPQMGESVVEGTVERWLVREGERVEKDQIVCEITTEKVDAEIPAPEAGVLTRRLVEEGTVVEVGAELAVIDANAEASVQPPAAAPEPAAPAAKPVPAAPPVESPPATPLAPPVTTATRSLNSFIALSSSQCAGSSSTLITPSARLANIS